MNIFASLAERFLKVAANHGFSCDGCGAEIFEYPKKRLCDRCESDLPRVSKRACEKCGRQTIADGVCLDCKSHAPHFTRGFSPFVYKGVAASFINRVKNGNPRLALYFGEQMAELFVEKTKNDEHIQALKSSQEPLLVLFVPMTEKGLHARGYNQAERLAESVISRIVEHGVAVETDKEILQKRKETAEQKKMGFTARSENVMGAYHIHKRKACKDRTLLLIDDIMTTGATGSECARKLLNAGAKAVYFLTAVALPERK